MSTDQNTEERELDARTLPKPQRHGTIFGVYDELAVGESFVLVNDHDPKHLRDEFERDHEGSFGWDYLRQDPDDWRIRITKRASAPLPRIVTRTDQLTEEVAPDAMGAVWKLEFRERDLDSNVIALAPHGAIQSHTGPDVDVLIHVLAGSGTLTTELGEIALEPGALLWMPRRSRRGFTAGPEGLRYLTVHQKRKSLLLGATRRA